MKLSKEAYARRVQASHDCGLPLVGPVNASLAVTQRCNSACSYCPSARVDRRADCPSPLLVDALAQLREMGVKQVSLTGGEPLLRDDLEELVGRAAKTGLVPLVLTNGVLLTEERARSLVSAGAAGFVVSLDALDPEVYQALRGRPLDESWQGVEVLARLKRERPGLVASVTCVLTRHNVQGLGELARVLCGLRLHLQVQPCAEAPNLEVPSDPNSIARARAALAEVRAAYGRFLPPEDVSYLEHIPSYLVGRALPEGFRCLAAYAVVHLDAELDVFPCWLEPAIGNLREASLAHIWAGEAMTRARARLARGECARCWLLCDAGPSLRYRKTG